ncbi:cytochrome c oxidase subunit 6A1, mitochondrial [Folsomia candida]|uniref:cytochrome c oxidase subunit 6A1, mitochondrial n=1 Tax=Folsomia candida TaxID=158441 RepID=UPI000B8F76BE|nr:cytochrome c oxidase subunit 6A1, mitochondrial [Folsomia candida]
MSMAFWKASSLYCIVPSVGLMSFLVLKEHFAHHACKEREPFVKYEYLRIRNKRYPWGDGTKTLFHNPAVNPLPDGYEDEL